MAARLLVVLGPGSRSSPSLHGTHRPCWGSIRRGSQGHRGESRRQPAPPCRGTKSVAEMTSWLGCCAVKGGGAGEGPERSARTCLCT